MSLWQRTQKRGSELPKWKLGFAASTPLVKSLEELLRTNAVKRKPNAKKVCSYQTNIAFSKSRTCSICSESHPLRSCAAFLRITVDEHINFVKKDRRCPNCLAIFHEFKSCKYQFACEQTHHSLLHQSHSHPRQGLHIPAQQVHPPQQINN